MDEATKIIKEQLDKIPAELRNYFLNSGWSNRLDSLLIKYNIEENKKTAIKNEAFLVLIGLEIYRDFEINIEREAELDSNTAKKISDEVRQTIFQIINIVQPSIKPERQNNIGTSFEQAILNQARAMRPIPQAPNNLPIGEFRKETREEPKKEMVGETTSTQNYSHGVDPYREPIG
jgi:hypothetical protein